MTLNEAKEILKKIGCDFRNGLFCNYRYLSWERNEDTITLDETFTVKELEAILVYMKESKK